MEWDTLGPLLGVVVGAVLGGGAQIVDSHLQSRRSRETAQRDVRRSTYVELLRATSQLINEMVFFNFRDPDARDLSGHIESLSRLHNARSELLLVAPEDTQKAGVVMTDLYMKVGAVSGEDEKADTRVKADVAREIFLLYAQRDVGFGPGPKRDKGAA